MIKLPISIGHKRKGFHLTQNQRLCLPAWLLEAHEGGRFTLIKYGFPAYWMHANVFKPLNHMQPGDIRACRTILLCSISHYHLIPCSLDVAPKPLDETFIIDFDTSPNKWLHPRMCTFSSRGQVLWNVSFTFTLTPLSLCTRLCGRRNKEGLK